MDIETLRARLLALRGTAECFPFDEETLVFKVCGKMYAVLPLERPDRIVLKCAPAYAQELRSRYGGIGEAYHFNKTHWNEVCLNADVPAALLPHLVRHAYDQVLHGLPKKAQLAFFASGLPPGTVHRHANVCQSTQQEVRALESTAPNRAREDALLVTSDLQRAGRGQRGTVWESENGKNLLFSLLLQQPGLPATEQFRLAQAAALALHDAVGGALEPDLAAQLTIKWPNDLYFADRKLAGMLIEHDLQGGRIARTAVGIGLNVNQAVFRGDAPNPASLLQLTGHAHARFLLLEEFLHHFARHLATCQHGGAGADEAALYRARLYRCTGLHAYRDSGGAFRAEVADVLPDGRLLLRREDGSTATYAHKEVEFVL